MLYVHYDNHVFWYSLDLGPLVLRTLRSSLPASCQLLTNSCPISTGGQACRKEPLLQSDWNQACKHARDDTVYRWVVIVSRWSQTYASTCVSKQCLFSSAEKHICWFWGKPGLCKKYYSTDILLVGYHVWNICYLRKFWTFCLALMIGVRRPICLHVLSFDGLFSNFAQHNIKLWKQPEWRRNLPKWGKVRHCQFWTNLRIIYQGVIRKSTALSPIRPVRRPTGSTCGSPSWWGSNNQLQVV